jgi:hypothetical protein
MTNGNGILFFFFFLESTNTLENILQQCIVLYLEQFHYLPYSNLVSSVLPLPSSINDKILTYNTIEEAFKCHFTMLE